MMDKKQRQIIEMIRVGRPITRYGRNRLQIFHCSVTQQTYVQRFHIKIREGSNRA